MFIINNCLIDINENFNNLDKLVSNITGLNVFNAKLKRRSIDSRKKGQPKYCCSFIFDTLQTEKALEIKGCAKYEEKEYKWPKTLSYKNIRPVIVGFGPAGMFAGLYLARAGLKPIILEKGLDIDTRTKNVEEFFRTGTLNYTSNVQFGEGGAGTFSDGKLNTGINDFRCDEVLKVFHKFSAPKEILYDAKPHIGTDILKDVVKNIRLEIISLGGEILFDHNVTDLIINNGAIKSIICNKQIEISANKVILAIGNSARDLYKLLYEKKVNLAQKPFSVGVRIEHRQDLINNYKYHGFKGLPAADYKMAVHLKNGRGVYTFCMCPGGYVINSSSEENGVVVNGMSFSKRDGLYANSALLVGVTTDDLKSSHPLAGIDFQREIENKVYKLSGGFYPISQTVGDFLNYKPTKVLNDIKPTAKPLCKLGNINEVLPEFVASALKEALPLMAKKIKGFDDKSAVLTAPETRSSSPVRILRNEDFETNIKGLYAAGEGAGYAGGIMSSAVDGLKCAENLFKCY